MTILAPKRPAEATRYVFDWSHQLGDDTIQSYTLAVTSGSVTIQAQDFTPQNVWAILAGGTNGQTSALLLTVNTVAGQVLQRDLSLLVSSTAIGIFPSTTTKGQLQDMAFEEIGLAGYAFDATAEEQASGLRRLDSLMARWAGPGMHLDVGYNFPTAVGNSNRADVSGVPDMCLDAVVVELALATAPGIGKTLSLETRVRYQQSMTATRAAFAIIPERSLPFSAPRGAGNKPRSSWWPYQGTPS